MEVAESATETYISRLRYYFKGNLTHDGVKLMEVILYHPIPTMPESIAAA